MTLIALPAFTDNYIWMLHDGRRAVVVDPGEAAPVLAALHSQRLTLAGILVTHHHDDHIGGVLALRDVLDGPVVGPARALTSEPSTAVRGGMSIDVAGWHFDVVDVPGHTTDHVAYFLNEDDGLKADAQADAPALFCGDTLFSAGCGRLFEGTPAQMLASLMTLAALPPATRVCCGHEYTLDNLRFALTVEPDNADIVAYADHCRALRARMLPTLPSTLAREATVNPFLRCTAPAVVQAALAHGADGAAPGAVFAALRQWKNGFR